MPPRKRTAIKRNNAPNKVVVIKTEVVPTRSLKPYYKNPRVGNVEAVAKSLHLNGQYKPIIVNIGTHTGRKMEILAGNHTWIGARRELEWESRVAGQAVEHHKPVWDDILASFVDVDEDHARAIVLADNRTADESTYDEAILAELFDAASMTDLSATGYKPEEVEDIVSSFRAQLDEAMDDISEVSSSRDKAEIEEKRSKSFSGVPLGEEDKAEYDDDELDDDEDDEPAGPTVEGQSETLDGMMQFKPPEQVVFEGVGPFGIPKLRTDMLMTYDDLPEGLSTWAGSATKNDDDPDRWWFYNWGVDSTSGMKDISRVILSFYCFDHYFENWWYFPERYMAKVINSGIKFAVIPNFSQATELPKVESLWALYRARWLGRYMQECGVKVVPDITWRDGDMAWLEKHVLATLPKKLPLISMQLQTVNEVEVEGGMDHFKAQIRKVLEVLQPEAAIIYTGKQGREIFDSIKPKSMKVRYLETRMSKLSEQAKGRKKKTTI